jgi:hypothetical protein
VRASWNHLTFRSHKMANQARSILRASERSRVHSATVVEGPLMGLCVSKLVNLQRLEVWFARNSTLQELASMPAFLQSEAGGTPCALSLRLSSHVTDEGLAYLSVFPRLQSLTLDGCRRVSSRELKLFLSGLHSLQQLQLTNFWGNLDSALSHLSELRELEALSVSGIFGPMTGIGLKHLSELPVLQSLSCDRLVDADLLLLCPTLRELTFTRCQRITDQDLQLVLSGLPVLHTLRLSPCTGMTDTGLQHLSASLSLCELELRGCCLLTDAGIGHLSVMSGLRKLDLRGCTNVSEEARLHLQRCLPRCTVSW